MMAGSAGAAVLTGAEVLVVAAGAAQLAAGAVAIVGGAALAGGVLYGAAATPRPEDMPKYGKAVE